MSEQIRSKLFNFGHEKEGSWPPQFGNGKGGFWRVGEDGKLTDEPREFREVNAPYVIQDSIDAYRHPGSGQVITSRKALSDTDKACGTITTDKQQPADPTWANEQRKLRMKDRKEAKKRALEEVNAPGFALPEKLRHECAEKDQELSRKWGIDASKIGTRHGK